MHDRDVIALEVVVDIHLPVAIELPIFPRRKPKRACIARVHLIEQFANHLGERRSVRVEIDEEKSEPRLDAKLRQRARLAFESDDAIELRRLQQTSLERIRPSVIAALQHRTFAFAFRDGTGAMTTNVGHRPDDTIVAAHDQQRFIGDDRREKLSRFRDLFGATGQLPCAREDGAILIAEDRGVDVVARRNRRRMLEPRFELPGHRFRRIRR